MKIDGVSAIAIILIASFAIDRVTRGALFLLSFVPAVSGRLPDPGLLEGPARVLAERNQKLAYFVLAGPLGVVVMCGYGKLRIFSAAGFTQIPVWLDTLATGLVLVGGADRVAALLGASGPLGGAGRSDPQPLQISGKITLEEPSRKAEPGD